MQLRDATPHDLISPIKDILERPFWSPSKSVQLKMMTRAHALLEILNQVGGVPQPGSEDAAPLEMWVIVGRAAPLGKSQPSACSISPGGTSRTFSPRYRESQLHPLPPLLAGLVTG